MVQNKVSSPRILRKRQQRLDSILYEALDLILSEGLDGLTMQKLAFRLDYAVGALYRYFKSKDALLAALQRRVLQSFTQVFQQLDDYCLKQLDALKPDVLALCRLYLAAEVYAHLRQVTPTRFNLLHEMIVSSQEILSLQEGLQVMQVALPLLKHIGSLFDAASNVGALEQGGASRRAIVFWASIQGLLPLQKLGRFVPTYSFVSLQHELLDTLFSGWGAEAELRQESQKVLNKLIKRSDYVLFYQSLDEGQSKGAFL